MVNKYGESIWFRTVDGVAVGTPIIGSEGKLIYTNHNTKITGADQSTRGFFSVFRVRDGVVLYSDSADEFAPFGPLALVRK